MLSWLIGNGLLVKENYNAIAMYFNSLHGLSVICVQKWMTQLRRKKCSQALILFVPGVQFWKRILYSARKDELA